MRKIFFCMFTMLFFIACSNSNETSTTADTTGGANTPGVDNVNGAIPDTTTGIQLNQPLPVDSSNLKDSARQR